MNLIKAVTVRTDKLKVEVINNVWPLEQMLGQDSSARVDRSLVLEMLENDWETTKELEDDRCQEGEEINI